MGGDDATVSLRDYVDLIHRELKSEMDRRMAAQLDAAAHVAADMNTRLGAMNEFRAAMGDVVATRVDVATYNQNSKLVDARVRLVEDRLSLIETTARTVRETRGSEQESVQRRMIVLGAALAFVTIAVNVVIALIQHTH